MKKLSFFLMAMLMSVMSFAAEATATISFANKAQRTVYTTSQQVWEQNGIVVTNDKASSTTNVGDYANPARFYKNSKVTIQCTLGNIKKIEITGWGDSKYNVWATSIGSEAATSGSSVIITPTAVSDTYVANMTGGQARAGQMVVTYEVSDEGFVATPAIEGEQYFKESATVSMKAAEGLKVYYTLDGTEPTTASTEYAAPFEVTETTTVKAIAHDGENASEVVTVVFKKMEVLTPSEAVALCTTTESADKYIIRGYVTKIATAYDASYNNITFWLADEADGGEILQAYRAVPVTENDKQVAEGAYVEIVGKLVLFGSSKTPEVPAGGTYTIIPAPVVNHTITVSANPAEAGTVTGGGEFEETDEITVKAVANDGYEFVNWTENEEEVSTDAEYTFAVLADRALVANFKKAAPATETVYFINAKKWAKVNVYAWTTDPNASWPGAAATKEAEQIAGYDVYSFTANAGQYANVIFNDGSSQTPDLVWTAGKYYVIDMGWLTKEEAETKLAAPLPETWNIVGAAGLMGKDWDLNAAENAMTKQEDGTYKLEKKGITIVAGSYEYKAAKDHGWTVAVPQDGNQTLKITTSGIYDVTFVLNVTAKKLTATATLKQAAVVIPTIVIAGDMNSWSTTKDKFTMSADSLTATFKTTLAVKNYGFKMIVGGSWHSDGNTITRAANSTKFTGANSSNNSTLKADIAGEYLFTWEYATKTLTVTYPALPVKYNVTVTAEHGTVTGAGTYEEGKTATLTATPAEGYQFVNWTKGEEVVSTENPYKFTVTADVALVANFELIPPTKYTVTLSDNTGGFEPLTSGAGEYEEGAEVTVSAVDSEGWVFVGWMDENGDIVSNDYQYTFVIEGNVALVAIYAQLMALEVNDLEIITEPVVGLTGTAELMPGMTLSFELIVDDSEQGEDGEFYLTEDSKVYLNGETEFEFLEGIALIDMMSNTAQAQVLAAMGETLYLFNLDMSAAAELVELVLTDAIVAINEKLGTLTFNVPTGEGEGYYVELSGYTAPGVHEGPQICLFETPEVAAYANYVETSVVDGVITLTGEFTSFMGAKFDLTISGTLPVVEPEVITYELNGGEFPAVVVPTNAELWGTDTADVNGFMHYYNHYYGLKRATQTIENVASFAYAQMQQIMTDEASAYKWLGDYVQSVATAAGKPLSTDMAAANESGWRWSVWAFFNACAGKNGSVGIDFTEAGKPEAWGPYYQAAHEVVLPTEPVAEDYVLPTPVKEGYTFVGWYDNAEGTGEAYTVIPAGWAGTLYAIWKQGPATALENIAVEGKAVKAIINGQLIIIKNGVQYNAQGQVVK